MANKISVVYAVHNEEKILARSLESVADWADEIVVVDGESSDRTREIATKYHAEVIKTTNKPNFHLNKQLAIAAADGDLILQLDADEIVDPTLRNFILEIAAGAPGKIAAWQIKRKNLFFRTWLTKGGQYPDPVIRLFWRGKATLPAKDVHEQMEVHGKLGTAKGHLLHYANPDLASYLQKFNTYTSFKAGQLAEAKVALTAKNFRSYLWWLPLRTFWSIWLRHRGYKDGWAGFLFAYFSGWHHRVAFWKYLEQTRAKAGETPRVYFPTSKIDGLQKHRGVGRYGTWLVAKLKERGKIQVVEQPSQSDLHHYLFFDLFRRGLKKVKPPQKLVVTVHDLIPLLFPADYPAGWRAKFALAGQKRRLKKAALVIADSQATKDDLMEKFKLPESKIEVVYLAANPALAPKTAVEIRKVRARWNLPQRYLLYVGDINANKNLPQLIKALKFLPPELKLVLVGKNFVPSSIPEWQAIQQQLDLSGVRERVKFLTEITDDDTLSAIYSGAAVYVQPSYYEGFGLPILEAMRCLVPVVCEHNSSLPEIAGGHAFYAASHRGEDLAAAISGVLALTLSERDQWTAAAAKWEARFSWDKTASQMEQLYIEAMKVN